MRRLLPLSALRAFEAAARHGSFKQAAHELAVTPTAISHRIRTLEEHTGLELFVRSVRQVTLTEAGATLFPVLRQGFDAFEAVLQQLTQPTRRKRVIITATNAFTAKWLVPRLSRLHTLHPDIDLQIHASDQAALLSGQAFDIALRYGRGPYPGFNAEPLFTDDYAPVVNPLLRVSEVSSLRSVPLIHFAWTRDSPDNPTWQRWLAHAGLQGMPLQGHLHYSDEGHAIQAVVAGQGIALLSLALVAEELAAGYLVQPFGPAISGYTYHLLTRADRQPEPSVQNVLTWLRQEFEACR
ncbi:LysR family transcriptional regulator, glycine cleavage system transcriptional activator [Pseudomonas flavescens]|uniref:LysR family transcriptional regulator, glycine cleavage system transcriptional activator n=1 Tax=Phytopseudomonas flavescens TaxID=29435 RepID=A0A1G7ZMJ8_9GAMM|nr:LysR substrate-binding domain-containing protein [Pseudomonas flavescens]SDH09894.1 LysR family transcriptional regulator, glycine cleavage system transcriptional activator [Pseudomonas flavescens]